MLVVLWVAGCGSSKEESSHSKPEKVKKAKIVGIDPLIYKCENLVTLADVSEALGGEITQKQVAFDPPPGTPLPCHYVLSAGERTELWSFDMDCRSDALETADALFEQYRVNQMNDAGISTNETGDLSIGRRAMDHHGQALIAVDDDTDCYIRVLGPSSEGRRTLGALLVNKLVWANAPIRPRRL